MLSPETNATTNATAEETNATTEAQMPGGRVKSWTTKDNSFLLGAAAATAGGVGSVAALAVASATIPPVPPPAIEVNVEIDGPPGVAGGIDPEILEHAQENAVTIYSVAVDENGEVIMELSHGSGFFIGGTEGQLIGTAAHVVEPPDFPLPEGAQVQTFVRVDGGEMEGTVFPVNPPSDAAVDGVNDIAIVDIGQTTGYTGIEVAPEGSANLGEELFTISTPVDPTLGGTVGRTSVASEDGQRVTGEETEDVIQLDGIMHGGQSGGLVIDSEGRLVGIITHGANASPYFPEGNELTISFATKSERLAELLEEYRASPEFLNSGVPGELAIDIEGFELWLAARGEVDGLETLGSVPDDIGIGIELPLEGPHAPFIGVIQPPDGPNVLIIGDDKSGFGPWSPDSPPDDGGVIDGILEALDALA